MENAAGMIGMGAGVTRLMILVAVVALSGLAAAAQTDVQPNLVIDPSIWKPHEDGGHPPSIGQEASVQASGVPAMRLLYRNEAPYWGNIVRPVQVPAAGRAIYLRFYKHGSAKNAALYLWLLEPDGDRWMQQVMVDGKPFGDLRSGWYEVEAPVGKFSYEGTGNGERGMVKADRLLIGLNYGDTDVSFADMRFVLAGETPGVSPAVLPPPTPVDGERGRIAILAENFVERRPETEGPFGVTRPLTEEEERGSPSAADPALLAELATRAGYGVTVLSASALSSPGYLSTSNFDVLVIPSAPYYPLEAAPAIRQFLSSGGSLFSTGGYAFDKPSVRAAGGWHTVSQALTAAQMDAETKPVYLNHRFGIPSDGSGPGEGQIPLFDPMNPLKGAAYAESAVSWIPRVRLDGPFEGWAASALVGSNDPVFPKPYARRIPLLMAYDSLGRRAGALGAVVHNFAGPYKGSSWAAFGVTNRDLFSRSGALSMEFEHILDLLTRQVYMHTLRTDLFQYRKGEAVTVSVMCANLGDEPARMFLDFEVRTQDGLPVQKLDPVEVEVPAGFQERVQVLWRVPDATAESLYVVHCSMTSEGIMDEMGTGFLVEDRALMTSAFPVKFEGNYFGRAEEKRFLIGTNQTGAIFSSAYEDPLVWDEDLRSMRDHGLTVMRVLHFSPYVVSETGEPRATPMDLNVDKLPRWLERKLDALVQLTAKHGIVLMLTLHDWMPLDLTEEELQAQRKFAALVAGRYSDCPHVMYDIQNEPAVELKREKQDFALWNVFLREKYGSNEALRQAWGQDLGSESLGSVTLERGEERWNNVRSVDYDLFRVWLLNRWNQANAEGVREAAAAPVTVGFIQHPTWADQLMGTEHLDYTNKHYYGPKEALAHEIKLIDRRWEGKSFSMGEFGSLVDHNARISGLTREVTDWEWYVQAPATVMALGGSHALNWCWKEMPDNVFPWGINTPNDSVPRETLLAFRAFGLMAGMFRPEYVPPEVYLLAPDYVRMGYGAEAAHAAIYRAIDALVAQRVEFGIINEKSLDGLPEGVKVLLMPVPFTMADATFQKLQGFVEGGGVLYVSGDISLDEFRRRSRIQRLTQLFGVDFMREMTPPLAVQMDENDFMVPSIQVKQSTAEPFPILPMWQHSLGEGTAIFNAYPTELQREPVREYGQVLDVAGIERLPVKPEGGSLQVMRTRGAEGDEFYFLTNRGDDPVTAELPAETALTLQPGDKAVVVYRSGQVTAVLARGAIKLQGREWAVSEAACAFVSLDGKPLAESGTVGAHLLRTGEIKLNNFPVAEAAVWIGNVRNGEWQTLGTRKPQETSGLLILPAENAIRFSMMLVGAQDALEAAGQTVARLLTFAAGE